MTAKEMFKKEGFDIVNDFGYEIVYLDGYKNNLGTRTIIIGKDMSVNAWESTSEFDYPIELTPNLMKAIIQQFREFGVINNE